MEILFHNGDRVCDVFVGLDGTFKGTWRTPSGDLMAVVLFDGEDSRERVDPKCLTKV